MQSVNNDFKFKLLKLKVLFFCLFFSLSKTSISTLFVPKSPKELIREADVVLFGLVEDVWVDSRTFYRIARVRVGEVAKAAPAFQGQTYVEIPLLDRSLNNGKVIERIPGAPEIYKGEELLLFLKHIPRERRRHIRSQSELFAIHGFVQGKMSVLQDALGVRRVLSWKDSKVPKLSDQELIQTTQQGRSAIKMKASIQSDLTSFETLDHWLNEIRKEANSK